MSHIVETRFGNLRRVKRDGESVWLLECPGCGQWGSLDDDQLHGRVSVDHSSATCNYHETHDFATELPTEDK